MASLHYLAKYQFSYCKFPAECNTERILKFGHYMAKLWTRVWCLVFYWTTVYIPLTDTGDGVDPRPRFWILVWPRMRGDQT